MNSTLDLSTLSTEELVGMSMDIQKQTADFQKTFNAIQNVLAYRVNEKRKELSAKQTAPVAVDKTLKKTAAPFPGIANEKSNGPNT